MSGDIAEKIARAVLYEGYLLYPYTASATKNRQRWSFGGLYPRYFVDENPGADVSAFHSQFLVESESEALLSLRVRFLELASGDPKGPENEAAIEREVLVKEIPLASLMAGDQRDRFAFPPFIGGEWAISAKPLNEKVFRLTLEIKNASAVKPSSRSEALPHSLLSTHAILSIRQGDFISLIDPPREHHKAADECRNRGWWPVLLGEPGRRDLLMVSPIILYDYPRVAAESPGDLFDGGEIDEILSLRIRALSVEEKAEIRAGDPRAKEMLDRTEALSPEQLLRLHGRWRDRKPRSLTVAGVELSSGSRVRICPKRRGSDAIDLILSGKVAVVESIEEDFEGRLQLVVAIEGDPGARLGAKAQLGHRFFFAPEEVEPL